MRLARLLLLSVLFIFSLNAFAQAPATPEGLKQPRILILLDGSSSMLNPWGKDLKRFSAASKIITSLMDSIYRVNNQVEFGLRVYGHQSPAQNNDCYDTKREVMFSKDNLTQMTLRLASIEPLGVSPIAYSLQEAANNDLLDDVHNAYSIILITDGGESCGGDICNVVQTLINKKIFFKPYILSLVDYAPLKTQYACLGTYLQVSKENEVKPAIDAIVEAYRPLLTKPIFVTSKPVPVTPAKQPEVKAIDIPVWQPEHRDIDKLAFVKSKSVLRLFHYNPLLRRLKVPAVARLQPDPVVVAPKKDTPVIVVPKKEPVATVPKKDTPVVAVVVPKKEPVKPPVKRHSDTAGASVVITPLPPVKTVVKPVKAPPVPKPAEFVTSTEDAKETSVEIYFTDGHGHFFKTTPQLELLDETGKSVKKFYRTIDANGSPDPQNLPAGNFDIRLAGNSAKPHNLMRHVPIVADKKNKIVVKVSTGSLSFTYAGAPERPVTEYDALASIRFEPGPTIKQHCTSVLEYSPGNYYIEVNTLPISRFNTDLDFGNETVITLPQPGYLQVTNNTALGPVTFYHPLGDKYVQFYEMQVTGNESKQKLMLKPGTYEVHWTKNPQQPNSSETILRFRVMSNSMTQIELQ